MPLYPGTRLGAYEVVALIAAEKMGEVYKATDTVADRTVALRVLPPEFSADAEMKQRLEREARTISGFNHPHICALLEIGRENDTDFVVSEYLEGQSLAERLKGGALPLDEALNVAIAIADALNKAHGEGIVHRDVKPSNIMLSTTGVKLLDFGLAKPRTEKVGMLRQSQESAVSLETLEYKAPEQLEGAEADARTDIFAFGTVLYEMVTG